MGPASSPPTAPPCTPASTRWAPKAAGGWNTAPHPGPKGAAHRAAERTLPATSASSRSPRPHGLQASDHLPLPLRRRRRPATGAAYPVDGPEQRFTTQPTGLGFSLPDDRAWEMVSPPDKHGGRITAPRRRRAARRRPPRTARPSPTSPRLAGSRPRRQPAAEESSRSRRRGAGGSWSTADLTPPHAEVTPPRSAQGLNTNCSAPNLESALLQPRDATPLSPQATERTPYLRENTAPPPTPRCSPPPTCRRDRIRRPGPEPSRNCSAAAT